MLVDLIPAPDGQLFVVWTLDRWALLIGSDGDRMCGMIEQLPQLIPTFPDRKKTVEQDRTGWVRCGMPYPTPDYSLDIVDLPPPCPDEPAQADLPPSQTPSPFRPAGVPHPHQLPCVCIAEHDSPPCPFGSPPYPTRDSVGPHHQLVVPARSPLPFTHC